MRKHPEGSRRLTEKLSLLSAPSFEARRHETGRRWRPVKWLQVDEVQMVFEGICIMTNNVSGLAQFYRELFDATSEGNDEHTTINFGGLGVAIWKRDIPDGLNDGKMKEFESILMH